ncbi:unnamed protein product, partial [Allacma fusca]
KGSRRANFPCPAANEWVTQRVTRVILNFPVREMEKSHFQLYTGGRRISNVTFYSNKCFLASKY